MTSTFKAVCKVDLRSRVLGRRRAVSWLEVFFDLVFVAGISQIGIPFAANYTPQGLLSYSFMFLLIWWAWLGHTMYSTRFDGDDLAQRALTLIQIFAVAVMAANAREPLGSRDSAGFIAAYAAMRLILCIQYLRTRKIPETRSLATIYAAGFGVAALLWLASTAVPAPPRFWIGGLALAIELTTPIAASSHTRRMPPDASHLPERFGLFTIILLGESVAAVMRGIEAQESWAFPAVASAVLTLSLVFGYWWWYFEAAAAAEERRLKSRRDVLAFRLWTYAHFPLYLGIAAAGVGSEHVISMALSARLDQTNAIMIVGSATALMSALVVITWCSGKKPFGTVAQQRLRWQAFVVAIGLGTSVFGCGVPPYVAAVWLLLLCGIQVSITYAFRSADTSSSIAIPEPSMRHS